MSLGIGFGLSASPAFAWYIYSWDFKYKTDCHFFEDPIEGTTIVCGKWEPAKMRPKGTSEAAWGRAPAALPHHATIDQIPRVYKAQVMKAAKTERKNLVPRAAAPAQ